MDYSEFMKLFKVSPPEKIGDDKLMSTAYHEAGHVLISLLYGLPGTTTTIIPDKTLKSAGSNAWHHQESGDYDFADYLMDIGLEWSTQKHIEYLVTSLLGGIIGESYYTGEFNWQGAISDLHRTTDIFLGYGVFYISDYQPYWDKTVGLISENMEMLLKISGDLYEHKTLHKEYFDSL